MSTNWRLVIIALIAGLPATIAALASAYITIVEHRELDTNVRNVETRLESTQCIPTQGEGPK